MTDWNSIRRLYMVPQNVVYLNNGSFGPAPRPVFDALVRYMKQLEENPAVFNDQFTRMRTVVKPKLAAFVGADPAYTAVVVNLTFGMNVLAQGIRDLSPGDEILATDQEYGAVMLRIGGNAFVGGKNPCPFGSWMVLSGADLSIDGRPVLKGGKIL